MLNGCIPPARRSGRFKGHTTSSWMLFLACPRPAAQRSTTTLSQKWLISSLTHVHNSDTTTYWQTDARRKSRPGASDRFWADGVLTYVHFMPTLTKGFPSFPVASVPDDDSLDNERDSCQARLETAPFMHSRASEVFEDSTTPEDASSNMPNDACSSSQSSWKRG
jgi:hypothetical protein